MISDGRLIEFCNLAVATSEVLSRFGLNFFLVLVKTSTERPAGFAHIYKITVGTRDTINNSCTIPGVSLVLRVNQNVPESFNRFGSTCDLLRQSIIPL